MTRRSPSRDANEVANLLSDVLRNARLILRLLFDNRVPGWMKAIPVMALLYALSPLDLLPDVFVGPGQLDDIALLLVALKVFLELCPDDVVDQHRVEMASVEGSYRVVDENPPTGPYVDVRYTVHDEEDTS